MFFFFLFFWASKAVQVSPPESTCIDQLNAQPDSGVWGAKVSNVLQGGADTCAGIGANLTNFGARSPSNNRDNLRAPSARARSNRPKFSSLFRETKDIHTPGQTEDECIC